MQLYSAFAAIFIYLYTYPLFDNAYEQKQFKSVVFPMQNAYFSHGASAGAFSGAIQNLHCELFVLCICLSSVCISIEDALLGV